MRLRYIAIGILLGALGSASANLAVKKYPVGIGKHTGRVNYATASGGTLTVARGQACTFADGSAQIQLVYTNTGGLTVTQRTLNVPANRTKPITDQYGNVIAASVPASTGTAIDSFDSDLDTQIGNAATGGKLNL